MIIMRIPLRVAILIIFLYNIRTIAVESSHDPIGSASVSVRKGTIPDQLRRLPSQSMGFKIIREQNLLYVDKTSYISRIMDWMEIGETVLLLTRPRRFGKTVFLDMIRHFFLGNSHLFEGTDIFLCGNTPGQNGKWNKYPVIFLDFNELVAENIEQFNYDLKVKIKDIAQEHNLTVSEFYDIGYLIEDMYKKYNQKVNILIDEYDTPFNVIRENDVEALKKSLLAFYCQIKGHDQADKINLVFITGISGISTNLFGNGLNYVKDLTFDQHFSTAIGFTEKEVKEYLKPYIEKLPKQKGMNYSDVVKSFVDYYDGYRFSFDTEVRVLNPVSAIAALQNKEIRAYWTHTSSVPPIIAELKRRGLNIDDFESLFSLKQSEFYKYHSPEDLPWVMKLFYDGYLTIHHIEQDKDGTKQSKPIVILDYPNKEVKEFLNSDFQPEQIRPLRKSSIPLIALQSKNIKKFIEYLNENGFPGKDEGITGDEINEYQATQYLYSDLKMTGIQCISGWNMKGKDNLVKEDIDLRIVNVNPQIAIEIKMSKPNQGAVTAIEQLLGYISKEEYAFRKATGLNKDLDLLGISIRQKVDKQSAINEYIYIPYRNRAVFMNEIKVSSSDFITIIEKQRFNQSSPFSSIKMIFWGNFPNNVVVDQLEE